MQKAQIWPKATVFIHPGETEAVVINAQGDEAYKRMFDHLQVTNALVDDLGFESWEDLKDNVVNDGYVTCYEVLLQIVEFDGAATNGGGERP